MVYKIISKFEETNFEKNLEKLSTLFDFLYADQALFLGLREEKNKEEGKKLMEKIFKPAKLYYIEPINEKNISRQSDFVRQWCLNKLVELDRQRFENQEQERLLVTWRAMDNMEAELQKIQKERG